MFQQPELKSSSELMNSVCQKIVLSLSAVIGSTSKLVSIRCGLPCTNVTIILCCYTVRERTVFRERVSNNNMNPKYKIITESTMYCSL